MGITVIKKIDGFWMDKVVIKSVVIYKVKK